MTTYYMIMHIKGKKRWLCTLDYYNEYSMQLHIESLSLNEWITYLQKVDYRWKQK